MKFWISIQVALYIEQWFSTGEDGAEEFSGGLSRLHRHFPLSYHGKYQMFRNKYGSEKPPR